MWLQDFWKESDDGREIEATKLPKKEKGPRDVSIISVEMPGKPRFYLNCSMSADC